MITIPLKMRILTDSCAFDVEPRNLIIAPTYDMSRKKKEKENHMS